MEFENQSKDDIWKVYFVISVDNAVSWTATDFINDGVEFDAIQPSILQYQDGSLQVLCRSRQGVITQSWSNDKGKTWSGMTATELPNPNSGTDALTLKDGRQLLVYNHTTGEGNFPSGRNMLNVALSTDGKNWYPVLTLEKQPGEYSYPSVIQDSTGLIHITYTYQRQSVKYVVVDASQW
jgi:predicted neuraminidase